MYGYSFYDFILLVLLRWFFFFFFNDPAPPEISPLPLHDALPISGSPARGWHPTLRFPPACIPGRASAIDSNHEYRGGFRGLDRKSTRLNSSHSQISYAVFCLKKKNSVNNCRSSPML